ncbi:exosome complex protein Rrp42 [Candidatus Pacearchaeota archaeon]|nr:exosome complex protein Rrp42 [Candidatus Pacearchaeota archaeon]
MSSMGLSSLTYNTLLRMFAEGKRFDGRKLIEQRDFTVEYNVSNKAEGSARVRMGNTEVVVGVKLDVAAPYPDSLDKGNLMVSGDLLPLASPRFESGPPRFPAIELPRLIDRMVRESHIIDLKKLVIVEGEKVWTVMIDIYPINDDGALIDAASIGTIAALLETYIPKLNEGGRVNHDAKPTEKLPLEKDLIPLTFTFYKLGDSLIIDPTREEEEACDGKIVWGLSTSKGKDHVIHSCQKGLESSMTREDIEQMMQHLPKVYDDTLKKLKKFLK